MQASARTFISYSSKDQRFARSLRHSLEVQGIAVWMDERELAVGATLKEVIKAAIDESQYFVLIWSAAAAESQWVQWELTYAMERRTSKLVTILPTLLDDHELPAELSTERYADFVEDSSHERSTKNLVSAMGVVFNTRAHTGQRPTTSLQQATDCATFAGLPILVAPFHRPFQYLGQDARELAKRLKIEPNGGGNFILENAEARMIIWVEGQFVQFVEVDVKRCKPCYRNQAFDPIPLLGVLSVNPEELEITAQNTHYTHFADHRRKMQVKVSCLIDGECLNVSFGTKYYGM
jgi:hypothetical protein